MKGLVVCALAWVMMKIVELIPGVAGTTPHEEFVTWAIIWLTANEMAKRNLWEKGEDKGKKTPPPTVRDELNRPAKNLDSD